MSSSKGKHPDFQKIKGVRLAGNLIKYNEYKKYAIADNELHNMIVVMLAITDEMVEATAAYIRGVEDPYYRLL